MFHAPGCVLCSFLNINLGDEMHIGSISQIGRHSHKQFGDSGITNFGIRLVTVGTLVQIPIRRYGLPL